MASTNKTTNYELSQFLGTDKPAWLSDYNSDMNKIDTQMKANADAATAAGGTASSAATAIGELTDLNTTVKTSLVGAVNEVNNNTTTAQNTATAAAQTANTNATKIESLEAYLNLNNFTTPSFSATGGTVTSVNVGCASNSTGSLGKIYGQVNVNSTSSTTIITFPTPLRPDTSITINGIATSQWSDDGNSWSNIVMRSITIDASGNATLTITSTTNGRRNRIYFAACIIFAKSFGDTPLPE